MLTGNPFWKVVFPSTPQPSTTFSATGQRREIWLAVADRKVKGVTDDQALRDIQR